MPPKYNANQFKTTLIQERKENPAEPDVRGIKVRWRTVRSIRAKLEWKDAVERFDTDQMVPIQEVLVITRYFRDITEEDRLFDTVRRRWFQVQSIVNVDEADQFLEINCVKWPRGAADAVSA